MRHTVTGLVLAATFLVPAMAGAQEAADFGRSGEVAISWDQSLASTYLGAVNSSSLAAGAPPASWSMIDAQYTTFDNNGGSATQFGLAPAADFFVVDNLSLGAQVLFSLTAVSPASPTAPGQLQTPSTTVTTLGIAPQIGYNIALGSSVSFWPKAFFAYATTSQSNNYPSYAVASVGLFAPLLFHPMRHFYLGLGPDVSRQVANSESASTGSVTTTIYPNKTTSLGFMATFGGYFGG